MLLNDSSVLNKSVLLSKAALSRIIATVINSYCLAPLTGPSWRGICKITPSITTASWSLGKVQLKKWILCITSG